ncbi:hypothetical protein DBR32_11280 [Taibaiella sp. KBW10]|uniref:hypothetical protein n=1 Tax=Taibaiella sp. KBW10 TaxID=2153357 RepID=UPI000F590C36|nr:hypothetical protein [Taibaiella sp. KBW10]RQO30160.1 hypothetical protein DBR32_11280 [Taibaiella sp. KBW10]
MKHLLKLTFILLAVALFTAASAQSTGVFLKFDINGKTISVKSNEMGGYNNFEPGDEEVRPNNEHAFYVATLAKQMYHLGITIHTPPHTAPVVGKLPYVQTVYNSDAPCPGAHISLTIMGTNYDMFASTADNVGHFEITKVAAGWVEGKFEIDIPKLFATNDDEVLHITNGSFRFKIEKEKQL